MSKKITTEMFIERAKEIHGDKYDYGLVKYERAKKNVDIICRKHEVIFSQMPDKHINGHGCHECGRESKANKRRKPLDVFVEEARMIHGNTYKYDLVKYKTTNTHITIVCVRHGQFDQIPSTHLDGSGCPKCAVENTANARRRSREQFIAKAIEVHGDIYDYSQIVYDGSVSKIKIGCYDHDFFEQEACSHLQGRGCPECAFIRIGNARRKSKAQFIEEAKQIHGNDYNYDSAVYIDGNHDIVIVCQDHGNFNQKPRKHLQGQGCPKCGILSRSKTQDEFIAEAKAIHGNTYTYNNVIYVGSEEKVVITCRKHNDFYQTPHGHLKGDGCAKCAGVALKTTTEFTFEANQVHDGVYTYNNTVYTSSSTKVAITCIDHGDFWQTPNSHLFGCGCPKCTKTISNPEIAWLNSLNVPDDRFHRQVYAKVGGRRFKFDGYIPETKTVYEFYGTYFHGDPRIYTPDIINGKNKKTMGYLYQRTLDGECILKEAGYTLITIWELDWNAKLKGLKAQPDCQ